MSLHNGEALRWPYQTDKSIISKLVLPRVAVGGESMLAQFGGLLWYIRIGFASTNARQLPSMCMQSSLGAVRPQSVAMA